MEENCKKCTHYDIFRLFCQLNKHYPSSVKDGVRYALFNGISSICDNFYYFDELVLRVQRAEKFSDFNDYIDWKEF